MLYPFQVLVQNADNNEDMPLIGKKAESLIALIQQGAQVPDGYCLSAEALEQFVAQHQLSVEQDDFVERFQTAPLPEGLQKALDNIVKEKPELHWAVRSSGVLEDLAEASFAGLYSTVLNVNGYAALEAAVRECWLSLFGERVTTYVERQSLKLEDLRLGVVIQAMIPAECSGVLFSLHPVKGHDTQMVIEAVPGLGEALVSGNITPDRFVYDWYNDTLLETEVQTQERCLRAIPESPFTQWQELNPADAAVPVLSPEQITELSHMAVQIQAHCGYPVDLEWVYYGQFYIVQRRPITQVFCQGIAGEWTTADFKDGGVSSTVCTPLMWALYDYIWEQTMPAYLRKTHLLAPEAERATWGDMFYARPYWNVGAVKAGLKFLPGFDESEFDLDLGIALQPGAEGHVTPTNLKTLGHGLKVLGALKKSFAQRMAFNPLFVKQQAQLLAELRENNLQMMSDKELFVRYAHLLLDDYYIAESAYFYHIFDNSNVTTLFKDALKAYRDKIDYLALMSGLKDLSHLRPNFELWELSRRLREDQKAQSYWEEKSTADLVAVWQAGDFMPMREELDSYLERFGHHSTRELDLTVPRFSEDPSFVFESLKNLLRLDDTQDPRRLNEKQYQNYLQAKAELLKILPFYKRKSLTKQLQQMRSFLWWREELRDYSTQMYAQVRRFTLEVAQRLTEQKCLEKPEDVFFLRMRPLLALLRGDLDAQEARDQVVRNRLYYQGFRHFRNPNEIGARYGQSQGVQDGDLSGVPCSPGSVVGTARVIQDIFDAERLEAGDILITRFTDPGWTPKFGLLSGVATETGGLLSHAAVISREYGIPAVLAVPDLMTRVQDGQRILLDGHSGQIVLDPSEEEV